MCGKVEFFKVNWAWSQDTDTHLVRKFRGKTILNFPCGTSKIGTVRADIDKSVNPDIVCDVYNPPFRSHSFDVVICDPPFSFYSRFKWLLYLCRISKIAILISSPYIMPYFKKFKAIPYVSRISGRLFTRFWVLYVRKQTEITLYL